MNKIGDAINWWIESFDKRMDFRQKWSKPVKLATIPIFYPDSPLFGLLILLVSPYSPFNIDAWMKWWKAILTKDGRRRLQAHKELREADYQLAIFRRDHKEFDSKAKWDWEKKNPGLDWDHYLETLDQDLVEEYINLRKAYGTAYDKIFIHKIND